MTVVTLLTWDFPSPAFHPLNAYYSDAPPVTSTKKKTSLLSPQNHQSSQYLGSSKSQILEASKEFGLNSGQSGAELASWALAGAWVAFF